MQNGRTFTDHAMNDSRDHWPATTEAAPIKGHTLHPYDAPRLCTTRRHTDRAVPLRNDLGAFSSFRAGQSSCIKAILQALRQRLTR